MKNLAKDWVFGTLVAALIATILYLPTSGISWLIHAQDISNLSQIDKVIEINQEEYDKAAENIKAFKEGSANWRFNADKPVASMVDAQLVFAGKLVDAKTKKTKILADIISRCSGPWRPVVWVVDNVTCDEYRLM